MIATLVDRPERVFQVWAYDVGMSRLLLRSTKSESHRTRIDVLFQNVKAMNLPTRLDGLVVRVAERDRVVGIIEQTGLLPDGEIVFFEVESSSHRRWFVVAGVVVEDEDDGEYFESSKYWPVPGP